jgi:hypothetical protein
MPEVRRDWNQTVIVHPNWRALRSTPGLAWLIEALSNLRSFRERREPGGRDSNQKLKSRDAVAIGRQPAHSYQRAS